MVIVERCWNDESLHDIRRRVWVPAPVRNCALGRDDDCGRGGRERTSAMIAKALRMTYTYRADAVLVHGEP